MRNKSLIILLVPFYCSGQVINTYAGDGMAGYIGDGGPSILAKLNKPIFVRVNSEGYLFVSDYNNNVIRKVSPTGVITTFAGNGTAGSIGDGGQATAAELNHPGGVAFDNIGNVFIADWGNSRIRKVDPTGVIITMAGTTAGYSGDSGPATNAKLNLPTNLTFDTAGNLYIADHYNHVIRMINTSGIISTFAGNGTAGSIGNGSPATSAEFYFPFDVKFDARGNLYIADDYNDNVRKISPSGNVFAFAGTGVAGYNGDTIAATSAKLWAPTSLAIDIYGDVLIADCDNQRIRIVDTFGIITTLVGNGSLGFSGDTGLAISAELNQPEGVALDGCGNIYIADYNNQRIRKVSYPPVLTTPTITLSGITTLPIGTTVTVNATISTAGSSYLIHWLNHGIQFTTTTVPTVTYIKAPGTDTITARVVPTGYGCWDSTTSAEHIVTTGSEGISGVAANSIFIYPNPAHNELTLITPTTPTAISITNFLGQLMLTEEINSRQSKINIERLPLGMYILQLTDNAGNKTVKRFLKQ